MTRHEAEKLLASFFARFGKADFAFDESTFVKVRVGEAILGFDFRPEEQFLICQALIYRFRRAPPAEVLRSLEAAAQMEETGGGEVVFDAESSTLSLVKTYAKPIEPLPFTAQMQKLAAASLSWHSTILARVVMKS